MNPSRKILGVWAAVVLAAAGVSVMVFWFSKEDFAERGAVEKNNVVVSDAVPRQMTMQPSAISTKESVLRQPVLASSAMLGPSQPEHDPLSRPLLAPVLPPNNYTLDDVTGTIKVGGRTQKLTGTEGLFDRVMIGESETVSIRLDMPNLKAGEEVVVAASNGGRLERHNGPLRFIPESNTAMLDLTFTSTMGRGAYNIDVRHAGAVATVTLWAGEPLPVGEPGPNFVALPPLTETVP